VKEEKMVKFKKFKPLRFGTSGLRALVTEMTDMESYINTRGFIEYLIETGNINRGDTILVAGDLRFSTDRIMEAVAKAIEDSGCKADNCGKIPSPSVSYYGILVGCASIMITGSHIPEDRNGIKFNKRRGEVLKSDEKGILNNVAKIRKEEPKKSSESLFAENGSFKVRPSLGPVNEKAKEAYLQRYLEVFSSDCLAGLKLVLYQHSAVGRDIIQEIFKGLGAEVIPVSRSEKFVPVDTENVSEDTRVLLRELAKKDKPYAIISTDGDSDRPLLADEEGEFLPGDKLGALTSLYLKPDFAAIPISANDAVVSALRDKGIKMRQTKIGSPYVIKAMNDELTENPAAKVVSWEVNGGFLTGSDWILNDKRLKALPTRDAVLPLLTTLLLAKEENKSVSELIKTSLPSRYTHADLLKEYPQEVSQQIIKSIAPKKSTIAEVNFAEEEVKVAYLDGRAEEINPEHPLASSMRKTRERLSREYFRSELGFSPISAMNFIDGIRIVFANNEVSHLRPSGNAPEFRHYATANTKMRAEEIVRIGLENILPKMKEDIIKNGKE